MPRFGRSGFFGPSRCLIPTPGLMTEDPICAVCVCVCVYTHIHPHTLPPALKNREDTDNTPIFRWCTQYLFNVNICAGMVLRRPVWMHATLPSKNAHAPVHVRPCNDAETSLPWKLLRTYLESCASIVQAVVCSPPCCSLDRISRPTVRLFAQEVRANPRWLMTRSPLQCRTSIIRSSTLVQASPSLFIVRTRAQLRTSSSTRICFHHFFRGLLYIYVFQFYSKYFTIQLLERHIFPHQIKEHRCVITGIECYLRF